MTIAHDTVRRPLAPVRGLIPIHNAKGARFSVPDVFRWMRLSRSEFKTEKVDLYVQGELPAALPDMVYCAKTREVTVPLDLQVSLRTDASGDPSGIDDLKARGLLDVYLCPSGLNVPRFEEWLTACRGAGLPIRVLLQPPFAPDGEAERIAQRFVDAGVVVVNLALSDPVSAASGAPGAASQSVVDAMNALASALDARGIEVNLYGWPLCFVREENRRFAVNERQFFADHQHYEQRAYRFAIALYSRSRAVVSAALLARIAQYTSYKERLVDERWLSWLLKKHKVTYTAMVLARKLIRNFRWINAPRAPDALQDEPERAIEQLRIARDEALGPECSRCSLRAICDHETELVRKCLPGLRVTAQTGELELAPPAFSAERARYYDPVDSERLAFPEAQKELARTAIAIVQGATPPQQFGFSHYHAENTYYVIMPGAVRWYALKGGEKLSSILSSVQAPFTLSVTFGGGFAEHIGFSLGRRIKVVCPMIGPKHQVALHVAADGQYVLLRDGMLVQPVQFEGLFSEPRRLPTFAHPRISIWNIDESVCTQNALLWQGNSAEGKSAPPTVLYSVVVVSTRFSRRLQASFRSIARQEGVELSAIEVIVGYVPGIDPTDDVLDSVTAAYPELRVVRAPFPEENINSKGFIINECAELASGQWVVVLDSDILLSPDFFAKLAAVGDEFVFAAPEGRKMLPKDTTGRILMGELAPWDCWTELLQGPGNARIREGGILPIGFCQCVKKRCFEKVRYAEYEHFEGADWEFAVAIRDHCGPVAWLDSVVMHLDHGGSQWFGARQQF